MPGTAAGRFSRCLPRCGIAAGCLVVLVGVGGCSPLVTAAASMLGNLGGGGGPNAPAGGAFGGAPSQAQNGHRFDKSVADVVDHVENQRVKDSCTEQIPEEHKAPVTECTLRPTCMPGSNQPMMIRVCPAIVKKLQDGAPQQTAAAHLDGTPYATKWRWEGHRIWSLS